MAETAQVGQNGLIPAIDTISAEEIGPSINGGRPFIDTLDSDRVILTDEVGDAASKKHGAGNRVKCHIEDSQASNVEDEWELEKKRAIVEQLRQVELIIATKDPLQTELPGDDTSSTSRKVCSLF